MQGSIKQPFFSPELPDLEALLISCGHQKYRARQVWQCVYEKKIFDPSLMTVLPLPLRALLAEKFIFKSGELVGERRAADDTGKYLFKLEDGAFVECVLLEAPAEDEKVRKTLCVSTQVGCAHGCKFCASTMRGFKRNLSAYEILAQLMPFANSASGAFIFENIVVMGMGEPLANLDNLLKALSIINASDKFNFGARRITVSTCGLADKISELSKTGFPFRLAISLHGATDEVRSQIMPINKKFPLSALIGAAKEFSASCGRMITLEYILIDQLNDGVSQAEKLVKIARDLHAHVNLIPYNKVDGLTWERSPLKRRLAFLEVLKSHGISATLRREKGADIDAACGQLALKQGGAGT